MSYEQSWFRPRTTKNRPLEVLFMKQNVWLRLFIAVGLALLLGVVLLGIAFATPARPQSTITMGRSPSPPQSVSRGMTEVITWTVTSDSPPEKIVYKLFDPNNVLIDTQEYPGTTGLSVTRPFLVPASPVEGPYWARVYYYSLGSGFEAEAAVKFLVAERGNLHVYKFNDINGDGKQQAGEGPIQGVLVRMRNPYGDIVGKYTGADGWITWDGIAIGEYQLTESVPPGYRATLPISQPATVNIDATTYVTFANQQLGNLRVFKYEDIDGDGQRDAGEGSVQGIGVTVRFPSGATETQLTDADGYTSWSAVPIGSYRITETLPAGWRATLPVAVTAAVNFSTTTDVTFANQRLGNLHSFVYEDVNGNGQQDAGENPVPDIQVTLHFPDGSTDARLTDVTGDIYWNTIPVGPYQAVVTVPGGWRATLPTSMSADVIFNATAEVIFAIQRLGNLRVFKYEDIDGDGQRDAWEGPVQGITVTVRFPSGMTETKLTAADGYISWNAIPVGSYRVTETLTARWRAILPASVSAEVLFNATTDVTFANQRTVYKVFLPLIWKSLPPPPTPTPTSTPSATSTQTATITATPTRTPIPTRPPIDIPGLQHPKGIAVDLRTHRLYVASRNTHVVYEVDPKTAPATVVRAIPVGREPFGVAVNNATGKVYVANFLSNSVSVISTATGAVIKTISLPAGEPSYVAINETTNRIYVTLHKGGRLAVIRGDTDALVTTVEVGSGPFGVAVDSTTNRIFVSCRDSRLVRVVDGVTNAVLLAQTVYLQGMPYVLGIDPNLGRLYVSYAPELDNPRQVLVYRIPPEGPSLLTAVLVGNGGADGGGGIGVNPLTSHVFVSNSAEDSVSVFNGITNMILDTVMVGDDPLGVAVDPGWSYVWVGNRKSTSISGIPDLY
jgi:YVTN family beta-propeller protein